MNTDALEVAEAALKAGHREHALDALLSAWRERRATELARLVDVVSDDLGRGLPALEVEARDFHAQWMAVEKDGRACDVPRLAPGLCAEPTSTLGLRVERLIARGDDPRTGRALLAMIDRIPTTSSSNFSIWVRAFKAMPSMLDTSAKKQLSAYRKREPRTTSQFWPKFHGWIDKLAGELSPPAALEEGEAQRVDRMLARARELASAPPATPTPAAKVQVPPVETSPSAALGAARSALAARDPAAAVSHVLQAWSLAPGPELVELLTRVSAAAPMAVLPNAPPKAVQAAWLALEGANRASDVPALLDRLEVGTLSDVATRMARLLSRPADPRVSMRMRAIVHEGKAGGEQAAYWSTAFDLLARSGDATDLELVRRLGEGDSAAVGRGNLWWGNGALLRRNGARVTPAMRERLEREGQSLAAASLGKAIAEVADLLPSAAAEPDEAMMAAIVASPDDDGPRLVYADKLTELGSPRGELIVVQCKLAGASVAPAERKKLEARQKALLKGRADLLGPLVDLVYRGSERFERGMLVGMQPQLKSERQRALLEHPMLSTVRDVELNWVHEGAAVLVTHPNLVSLRTVGTVHGGDLAAIFGCPRPLPLVAMDIGLRGDAFTADEQATIAEGRALPDLRVLRASFWDGDGVMPSWMMRGALVRRLERIEIGFSNSGQEPAVAAWIRALREHDLRPALSLAWGSGECTVVDGVVRAKNRYTQSDPVWNRLLREARSVAKEVVLEGPWPANATKEILDG